ncbi:MAG: exodeoxyribonuclease VII large subunit [Halanaerobiales bacterium]
MAHQIFTVEEITKYIKTLLSADETLRDVYLTGEISNFYHHNSGHMYFTIKDKKAAIKSVMFKGQNNKLDFEPEDGMEVTAHGYIDIYEARGVYQFYVQEMEPEGKGALYLAFERLKERLEKEGLFAPEHKKDIPILPEKIGVVTSPTGAAIRDILSVVKRRFDNVSLLIVPSHVQGEKAASELVGGIKYLNKRDDIDLIIISRGGGNLEQLWPFNEEKVARAIFNSRLPIISGVGHETDFTIADFVADLRAPTPSAAAELAVSNRLELQKNLQNINKRLLNVMKNNLQHWDNKLQSLAQRSIFTRPQKLFTEQLQSLDNLSMRLEWGINNLLSDYNNKFSILSGKLESLSPLKTLNRGFSVVSDNTGEIVSSINEVNKDSIIYNRLVDGIITSRVTSVEEGDMGEEE